jgi:transposase
LIVLSVWTIPLLVDRNTTEGEGKMGKKGKERRNYTKEFKAEAVGLAEKREKPADRIALDLGVNGNMLRRRIRQARETKGTGVRSNGVATFPGHGRPRDEELAHLRKEVKSLREANEILKKRRSSSRKRSPGNGVPVHESESGAVRHQGDGRSIWGKPQRLLPVATGRGI